MNKKKDEKEKEIGFKKEQIEAKLVDIDTQELVMTIAVKELESIRVEIS